jgi:murein DD-endopeptidase MepM/ murein hydrolase activator NlpD
MPIARPIVRSQRSRVHDRFGSGQFGVSRDGGRRFHQGLDIVTRPNEEISSPIDGLVIREAKPYRDDPSMLGVVIRGNGAWEGYQVKIFYAKGLLSGPVSAGQTVAVAQDLALKYPGITNHVHVEVTFRGAHVSPDDIFAQCF